MSAQSQKGHLANVRSAPKEDIEWWRLKPMTREECVFASIPRLGAPSGSRMGMLAEGIGFRVLFCPDIRSTVEVATEFCSKLLLSNWLSVGREIRACPSGAAICARPTKKGPIKVTLPIAPFPDAAS